MTDAEIQALLQAGMSTNAITHQHHVGQKRVLRIRRALGIAPAGWIKPPAPSRARRFKSASTAPLLVLRPAGQPSFGSASDPLVAEFIRKRGVTRCPAAIVAYTTAEISAEDATALAAYHANRGAAWGCYA